MTSLSRPSSAFTETFTPSVIENAPFLSRFERSAYNDSKEEIQKIFASMEKTDSRIIHIDIKTMTYADKNTCYGLTDDNLQRLKNNIEHSGFHVHLKKNSDHTGISISLPETDLDESGRRSPGWSESFKASEIKKKFQKLNVSSTSLLEESSLEVGIKMTKEHRVVNAYIKTVESIEYWLKSDSNVAFHDHFITKDCPSPYKEVVADWIVEDLINKGFDASKKTRAFEKQPLISISKKNS